MGHRANYILRRGGRTQRFVSRWGGLSLSQDIFWGPEETTRFVRRLQPTEKWRSKHPCDAGAIIDWDARQLTWFEADYLRPGPLEQRLYALLLQQLWPDWQILFAPDSSLACQEGQEFETDSPDDLPDDWLEDEDAASKQDADLQPAEAEATDERTCLAVLITRLLDQTRFDPEMMLGGVRRATLEANAGCGCLTVLVGVTAVAVAAWNRTAPTIIAAALVVLAILVFTLRVRLRSARLMAMLETRDEAPQPAGPSLAKKRSILDQALARLGWPTTDELEQAGELKLATHEVSPEAVLPDRFGPLRPLRAAEVAGVGFYQLQVPRLRFRELRRGTTLWRACLIKLLAPLGHYAWPTIPVPRVQRLVFLNQEDLPPHACQELQPWMTQAVADGFSLEFFYTLPMLGRQEAFSAVLRGREGGVLASLMYARVRLRVSGDEDEDGHAGDEGVDESCDEEMFEASLLTRLADGRLLVTTTRAAELDPLPGHELQTCADADWPTLLAAHLRRLAPQSPSAWQAVSAAELPELLLRWNQQEIDHHAARGVYQQMTREDIDRFAEEG